MAETAPYSRIIIKTVDNTDYISIPFGKPEYFGSSKKFNFRITWGDGKITNLKNNYNYKDVSWDRNYDSSGRPQNPAPQSDTALTITHKYETAGQYDIEVRGGFDNSMDDQGNSLNNNDNQLTLKLCFAKSSDRMSCRGTPEVIEEINGIGGAHRGEIYVHGQGDFEDFINLKEINCGIRLLTSANPKSNLLYDGGAGKVAFINTFKNCEKIGLGKKNRIRTLPQGDAKIIDMEGCFDNCGYNGFLPWDTSLVTNWKRAFRKSKNHAKIAFDFSAAENLDYALEDSYAGRAYRLPVTVNKGGSGIVDAKWKFVLAKQTDNIAIWSNDGSTLPGDPGGKQPQGSIVGKTNDSGNFNVNLGDINLMECIDPDSYLDQETENDFINLRLHSWCSTDGGSSFQKISNKNLNLNVIGTLKLESDFLFGDLRNVVSMVGTFKDHKKFDANLLRRCFTSNVVYKLEDMEACFEGVDFLKLRNSNDNGTRFRLRLTNAKPISIKSYIRNSKNAFDIRYMDGSRITNISHFVQNTDYNQTISFDMQKVTDTSYAFAGCTGNPYIRTLWLLRSGDGKNFANINCEGMFEGSSNWDTDLPWKHLKPTSTERMFNNCSSDFKSSMGFGTFDNCTTIRAMFRNSGVKAIGNLAALSLKNVVDASYAFKGTQNDVSVNRWFSNPNIEHKIENIDGMFEGSVNTTITNLWAEVISKTVKSARAVFKNNRAVPLDNIVKTFRNTSQDNVVEQIDEFFRGILLKTGEFNTDQRRFIRQWHVNNKCENQFNVLKAVSFGGPATYSSCRYKNYESDDQIVIEPEYEEVNLYQKSEVTYDHICEDQLIDEVSIPEGLDTVFMAIY